MPEIFRTVPVSTRDYEIMKHSVDQIDRYVEVVSVAGGILRGEGLTGAELAQLLELNEEINAGSPMVLMKQEDYDDLVMRFDKALEFHRAIRAAVRWATIEDLTDVEKEDLLVFFQHFWHNFITPRTGVDVPHPQE